MQPRDPALAIWIATFFGAFALIILAGQALARRRIDGIWRMFGIEVLAVSWFLGSAWLGGWWFVGAMALTAVVTSLELTSTVGRLGARLPREAVAAASAAYCLAAAAPDPIWLTAAPALFAVALLARPIFSGSLDNAYVDGATAVMASLYPGFCLAFAVLLMKLGNPVGDLLFLFAVLEVNDAAAFLTGRLAGRHPYAPVLSPKKTIEGAIGGIAGAVAAGAFAAGLLPGTSAAAGAAWGLTLGAAGQAADLAASAIKRQAGVKDFAWTIPTQGGVLDVYDAVIVIMPVWFVVRWLTA